MSDISPGQDKSSNLHFLVKVVRMGQIKDEMMLVDVTDEENISRSIAHESHAAVLITDNVYVVHRAKIIEGVGVVDGWSMLVLAPNSYTW